MKKTKDMICCNCLKRYAENDLVLMNDETGSFYACPECGTDENLVTMYKKDEKCIVAICIFGAVFCAGSIALLAMAVYQMITGA